MVTNQAHYAVVEERAVFKGAVVEVRVTCKGFETYGRYRMNFHTTTAGEEWEGAWKVIALITESRCNWKM